MNAYMQASLRFCQNGGIWADLLQNIVMDGVQTLKPKLAVMQVSVSRNK